MLLMHVTSWRTDMTTQENRVTNVLDLYHLIDKNEFQKDTKDWLPVVQYDDGAGYEWHEFYGWYSPSARQYYWLWGSGCSCNDIGDGIYGVGDFAHGDYAAIRHGLREHLDYSYNMTANDKERLRAKLRTFERGLEK
jgi:hypothetical protein